MNAIKAHLAATILPVLQDMTPEEREPIYRDMSKFLYTVIAQGEFKGHKFDLEDLEEILEWCRENV